MASSVLRKLAQRAGLGPALRVVYHRPVGKLRKSIREGGPIEQRRTERGRLAMIEAAKALPPLQPPAADEGHEVHFLTGANYWYQTVFCHASLQRFAPSRITPVLYDDGTLAPEIQAHVRRVIPWARIVTLAEIEARLDAALPWSRYPTLRQRRIEQPLIRKVLDLHAGESGWKMLLDSDMLFFQRPDWLLDWLAAPSAPAYMVDVVEAYGYSEALRSELVGGKAFPDRANIGIFGWRGEDLDVDWLEAAVARLLEVEGTHYNLTQGITSMLFAGRACDVAPERDYLVLPSVAEGRRPTAVLHHYVAESKRSYFQHGWRIVEGELRAGAPAHSHGPS